MSSYKSRATGLTTLVKAGCWFLSNVFTRLGVCGDAENVRLGIDSSIIASHGRDLLRSPLFSVEMMMRSMAKSGVIFCVWNDIRTVFRIGKRG